MKLLKDIKFIKNGNVENFDEKRMLRFLERLKIQEAQTLIDEFCEEINEVVKVENVINLLSVIASRKITPAKPRWEFEALKLYLYSRLQKDWQGSYPHLKEFLNSRLINPQNYKNFSEKDIEELNDYMNIERDNLFGTLKAGTTFYQKYCLPLEGDKKEMPQLAYMRVAMFLTKDSKDLQETKDLYDDISLHRYTLATPIMVNSGTFGSQTSSCVLMETDDTTDSILDTNWKIGVMSKNLAGVALNVQKLRSRGSKIINGVTSGPIPFIKVFESTISAWNQGGTRPGALCCYFNWYHPDIIDLLSLRSNGGTEENRARRLKFALKINDIFIRKVMDNEEVALVSHHEAPELYGLYGEEFEKAYEKYLKDPKVKKIKAREIWSKCFKERSETGNIYLFHEENVNEVSMLKRYIGTSNLCTEVVLPTSSSTNYKFE